MVKLADFGTAKIVSHLKHGPKKVEDGFEVIDTE